MTALTVRLPNSVHQKVRELAERDEISAQLTRNLGLGCIHGDWHGDAGGEFPDDRNHAGQFLFNRYGRGARPA